MTDEHSTVPLSVGTGPVSGGPLAGLIATPAIDSFDRTVDGWAELLRGNRVADRLFYGLSTLGDHGIIWHLVGLGRVAAGRSTLREAVELSSALGVEAALVNGPLKWLFRRERPTRDVDRPHRLRQPRTSSFPSGHASAGMFAAMLVAHESQRKWPWYVLGGLVGWSRVHVRIHHPSDVVGGAIVGLLLGRASLRITSRPIR